MMNKIFFVNCRFLYAIKFTVEILLFALFLLINSNLIQYFNDMILVKDSMLPGLIEEEIVLLNNPMDYDNTQLLYNLRKIEGTEIIGYQNKILYIDINTYQNYYDKSFNCNSLCSVPSIKENKMKYPFYDSGKDKVVVFSLMDEKILDSFFYNSYIALVAENEEQLAIKNGELKAIMNDLHISYFTSRFDNKLLNSQWNIKDYLRQNRYLNISVLLIYLCICLVVVQLIIKDSNELISNAFILGISKKRVMEVLFTNYFVTHLLQLPVFIWIIRHSNFYLKIICLIVGITLILLLFVDILILAYQSSTMNKKNYIDYLRKEVD